MDHLKAEKIMCKALFAILFTHYNQNSCLINTSCEYKSDFYNNKKETGLRNSEQNFFTTSVWAIS